MARQEGRIRFVAPRPIALRFFIGTGLDQALGHVPQRAAPLSPDEQDTAPGIAQETGPFSVIQRVRRNAAPMQINPPGVAVGAGLRPAGGTSAPGFFDEGFPLHYRLVSEPRHGVQKADAGFEVAHQGDVVADALAGFVAGHPMPSLFWVIRYCSSPPHTPINGGLLFSR